MILNKIKKPLLSFYLHQFSCKETAKRFVHNIDLKHVYQTMISSPKGSQPQLRFKHEMQHTAIIFNPMLKHVTQLSNLPNFLIFTEIVTFRRKQILNLKKYKF